MEITLKWVPHDQWPRLAADPARFNVWISYSFVVQAFHEKNGVTRLRISSNINNRERDSDDITWSELQAVKAACGYGNFDAVEAFPPDDDAVSTGDARHLWVFPKTERMWFFWRKPGHQMSLLKDMLANKPDEEKGV